MTVSFYLNGSAVSVDDPSPNLLLIDFLRSASIDLKGAKKGCGQGGCGACTVILSEWDAQRNEARHRSINSCLRPVCSLNGLSITTIEGTGGADRLPPTHSIQALTASRAGAMFGAPATPALTDAHQHAKSVRTAANEKAALRAEIGGVDVGTHPLIDPAVNPVAYRLAVNNGSQCGYCSTGFVMNMSAFLANNPKRTKKEIEQAFDGNICRCTGYRAILTAMKTFAIDWSPADEANRMPVKLDDQLNAQQVGDTVTLPFAEGAKSPPQPITVAGSQQTWMTPSSLPELVEIYRDFDHAEIYLLHANTALGVYREDFLEKKLLVDISRIEGLYGISQDDSALTVGAGATYTELFDHLQTIAPAAMTSLAAVLYMAHRTAGTVVRNAATIGGNTMLVLKHIGKGTGEPFPSDVLTVLAALDATIRFTDLSSGQKAQLSVSELVAACQSDPAFAHRILLMQYNIPVITTPRTLVQAQKVALRDVNSHSIVNTTSVLSIETDLTVTSANLTFGGIAPYPWRAVKTEAVLAGQPLSLEHFDTVCSALAEEVQDELNRWADRMQEVGYDGFTSSYRIQLASAFLYKAMVSTLVHVAPESVPASIRSAADETWGNWPVSKGSQHYKRNPSARRAPVAEPYVKLMALYQTSGQVRYTHELDVPPTTLEASFVQSKRALADYSFKHPETGQSPITSEALSEYLATKSPHFRELITHNNIPAHGLKNIGMGGDQPVFAEKRVSYVGQSIALVVGDQETAMDELADFVSAHCIDYAPVDWAPEWVHPVLTLPDAIARKSIFPDYPAAAAFVSHIWKIIRKNSQFDWSAQNRDPLDQQITVRAETVDEAHCKVIGSTQACGGQAHFYMETQACVAIPETADTIRLHPSSQSPMEMHTTAAAVLGIEQNHVKVQVHQVGGGYGGKTEQAKFVTAAAAVAAKATNKPIRLVMPRDNDTSLIGKRHPYYGQYQIAIDDGSVDASNRGLIRGLDLTLFGDGGAFYDCSFIVANCIQSRIDGAYNVANFRSTLDVCRTNTAPNTAFRSFGDVQGKLISENAVDDAAFAIGMRADEVREKNLYAQGDVTPFGQALPYCYIRDVWKYLKTKADFDNRLAAVEQFNAKNTWRKRGIYMLPVKYGSGYNLVQLEQASALVSIYATDGTVLINQSGVDMGQGLVTKIEQIASYVLNVPMEHIRVNLPNTEITPNPTSTGGSTGTQYNGLAVKKTCERVRDRLEAFAADIRAEKGDDWCRDHGINFWAHPEKGWATTVTVHGRSSTIWQNLISLAYTRRVSLVEAFNAKVPGGEAAITELTYKTLEQAQSEALPGIEVSATLVPGAFDAFSGFTYSAACSEIELDILTGEMKILRSDVIYDMGWSINPALDIGQVEGAFVQGVGYVTTEKLVFEPDGDEQGRLNTVNTWRYKPPATTDIPLEFNVHLFPRDESDVPENPNDLLSAKDVGEPPLVLASSVFFAIKAAVRASRLERGLPGLFQMDAPATVQEIRAALEVTL
ncbi:MAG: molybdopterin cofactor-binding domain-containing protein [Pseudomonadota bacterium]